MTRLVVTTICVKGNDICYSAVKIHLEGLDRLVPSERGKCDNTQTILNIVMHKFPPRVTRKVEDDPSLKMIQIVY